jgi:hypothetical protein
LKKRRLTSRNSLYSILRNIYPLIKIANSEEFDDSKTGGLYSTIIDDQIPNKKIFDYNGKAPDYELGVIVELQALLNKHGWYAYFYNTNTVLFYPNPE